MTSRERELLALLAEQERVVAEQATVIAQLRARIAELEARLGQIPRNSSRPPSSEGYDFAARPPLAANHRLTPLPSPTTSDPRDLNSYIRTKQAVQTRTNRGPDHRQSPSVAAREGFGPRRWPQAHARGR